MLFFIVLLRNNNLKIANTKTYIQICKNPVEFKNEIAIWTLLTGEMVNYGPSSIKLLKSIIKNVKKTKFDAIIMELTNKPIESEFRSKLLDSGWVICQVDRIAPREGTENATFSRYRDQFTKLLLWKATEYKAHYYFDADTLVIRNVDNFLKIHENFDPEIHKIGCTGDIWKGFWKSTFNMGVFVLQPNKTEFNRLVALKNDPDFKFEVGWSEQGFLNAVYKNLWYNIGFENNANLAVYAEKRDFWDANANFIRVIHYTIPKPWSCSDEYKGPCDLWRASN